MKIKINYSQLLRTDDTSLFKWSKYGVIIKHTGTNLDKMNKFDALETLDNLEDNLELTFQMKQDINEVREHINELNNNQSEYDFLDDYTSFD